ncbi:uromodulin-like isoform X2 [Ambystoma mexicanum]
MNPVLGVVLAALLGGAGAAPCFDGDAFPPLCAEVYCAGNCTSGSGCLCSDNNTICVPDETTGCVLNSSACCPSGLFWHPAQSCCSVEPSCSPECLSDEICTDINGVSECRCNRTMYRLLDRRDLQPVVTCRGATMNISISRCLLESFGYNGSSMALRNSNESCNLWSQGIKDNKSVLTLEVLLMVGWCGNEISVNTSYVRYSNVLQVHPLLTEIVRVNPLNLSFSCSIARAVQTRLELDLQPAINSSSGLSDLGFTTTPPLDLQTHFSSSPFVPLNSASPLYVGISTAFVDMPRFSLRTEHCFSNPTGDPSLPNSLELITNG